MHCTHANTQRVSIPAVLPRTKRQRKSGVVWMWLCASATPYASIFRNRLCISYVNSPKKISTLESQFISLWIMAIWECSWNSVWCVSSAHLPPLQEYWSLFICNLSSWSIHRTFSFSSAVNICSSSCSRVGRGGFPIEVLTDQVMQHIIMIMFLYTVGSWDGNFISDILSQIINIQRLRWENGWRDTHYVWLYLQWLTHTATFT